MRQVMWAMAAVAAVGAVLLLVAAGFADESAANDALFTGQDAASAGKPWRIGAAVSAGLAVLLGGGALAAPKDDR